MLYLFSMYIFITHLSLSTIYLFLYLSLYLSLYPCPCLSLSLFILLFLSLFILFIFIYLSLPISPYTPIQLYIRIDFSPIIYKYIKEEKKNPLQQRKNRVTIVQIDLYYSWEGREGK